MNKTCLRCRQNKQLDDFVKTNTEYSIDGYRNVCKVCHNASGREYYHKDWKKQQLRREKKHHELKIAALNAYGIICQCCKESEISFLTIDHIYNDGAKMKKIHGVGHNFYQWLKNNNYPHGFQVLCMNCNFSKYTNGGACIHQEKKNE